MNDIKILVVSATPFRKDYKSRFLESYLKSFKKENIFYFFVTDTLPDPGSFNSAYKITDRTMFRHLFSKKVGGEVIKEENVDFNKFQGITGGKDFSPLLKKITRKILWRKDRWNSKLLNDWLLTVKPDAVLLVWHDNIFLNEIAKKIADKYKLPLVISINDDYIFQNNNRHLFRYAKSLFEKENVHLFYISDLMKERYDLEFNKNGLTIHSSSNIKFEKLNTRFPIKNLCYFGSVSLGRLNTLLFFAKKTNSIGLNIDLYANSFLSKKEIKSIKEVENVCLKDPISYEKIRETIKHYDAILLAEELHNVRNINAVKYSLTTKIGDSLAYNKPKIFIGNSGTGLIDFALKNKCGFVITEKDDPVSVIEGINYDMALRVHENSKVVYLNEFCSENSSKKFLDYLNKVIN